MIADPVAQCESALGLPPVGLLRKDQIYSKFWVDRSMGGCVVDTCRSPMIDISEHNPITVVEPTEDMKRWYQYLPSGIIYSIYDTSCFRHSDSDYDLFTGCSIKAGEPINLGVKLTAYAG